MKNGKWEKRDMPDLTGKIAIVTGANSGLGLQIVKDLAAKNCHVVMASRNMEKLEKAKKDVQLDNPEADVRVMQLDLADLSSIRNFSREYHHQYNRLDILCNNAGVMNIPERKTADGFEMQFGTNHLGHFALTGLLFELLKATKNSRIVTTSSLMHKYGKMNFENINLEGIYSGAKAYGQSKLANLLFAYELQRKIDKEGLDILSVASHPGYTATNLQLVRAEMMGSKGEEKIMKLMNRIFGQNIEMGVLPTLYAATAEDVKGGDYYGPSGFQELKGHPKKVESNDLSHNLEDAQKIWILSEKMTGIYFPFNLSKEKEELVETESM